MGNPAGVRRDFEELEERRLRAAQLLREGVHQAEVARQVGRRPAGRPAPRGRPGLTYESGLRVALGEADLIGADELRGY